jgi:hypothetical protein
VAANGTIIFTVNFEQGQDAWVEFVTWTRNGDPLSNDDPDALLSFYVQGAPDIPIFIFNEGTVLDTIWKQGVDGCPGLDVSINESMAIYGYYLYAGEDPGFLQGALHVANDLCAVEKVPAAEGARCEKLGDQVATYWSNPLEDDTLLEFGVGPVGNITANNVSLWDPSGSHYYAWQVGMCLDEHVVYGLEKEVSYNKTIRWFSMWTCGEPVEDCVMFSLLLPPAAHLLYFYPAADVYLLGDEDINPANNEWAGYADWICILYIPC